MIFMGFKDYHSKYSSFHTPLKYLTVWTFFKIYFMYFEYFLNKSHIETPPSDGKKRDVDVDVYIEFL